MWFTKIIEEVEKLKDAGFYALEASNFNHWYLDTIKKRVMFLSPHWITPSLSVSNQLGFATYRMAKTEPEIKLTGVGGLYISAVLATYNFLIMKNTSVAIWNANLDNRGRFPCFNV